MVIEPGDPRLGAVGRNTQGPSRGSPLWQHAADAVRHAIVAGALRDGVRVSEASLAETLGVSRAPVREAIGVLVQEGLLRRGAWATAVVGCSPRDVERLFELRAYLETCAIRLAAGRLA